MDGGRGKPVHVFRMQNALIIHIKEGRKTVEGRLGVGVINQVAAGNIIRFKCGVNHVDVKVQQVIKYKSFHAFLEGEGVKNCLPDSASIQDGIQTYHSLYRLSCGNARGKTWDFTVGVVALRISTDFCTDVAVVAQALAQQREGEMGGDLVDAKLKDNQTMIHAVVHPKAVVNDAKQRSRSRSCKRGVTTTSQEKTGGNEMCKPEHVGSKIEMWS